MTPAYFLLLLGREYMFPFKTLLFSIFPLLNRTSLPSFTLWRSTCVCFYVKVSPGSPPSFLNAQQICTITELPLFLQLLKFFSNSQTMYAPHLVLQGMFLNLLVLQQHYFIYFFLLSDVGLEACEKDNWIKTR